MYATRHLVDWVWYIEDNSGILAVLLVLLFMTFLLVEKSDANTNIESVEKLNQILSPVWEYEKKERTTSSSVYLCNTFDDVLDMGPLVDVAAWTALTPRRGGSVTFDVSLTVRRASDEVARSAFVGSFNTADILLQACPGGCDCLRVALRTLPFLA
ncbi:hypothetical protein EVAR_11219_1 [Eumeta japonica]|uniref:Uncharacterized protein n=1 Tax=Eumeta variegata TaxID=151549 RepID=A0A4C2A117_EUMVA|nr:hypothetical protein EVAR_11219_1 [Eumeta japonica]